jgi:hypothetical protein
MPGDETLKLRKKVTRLLARMFVHLSESLITSLDKHSFSECGSKTDAIATPFSGNALICAIGPSLGGL